ncbi:MAG: hypothetical protein M1286_03505 [Candidatus Marsarchaeota archaeon]|nr:hypothetical protein [Candidatus Marsarchaeota archaeon]
MGGDNKTQKTEPKQSAEPDATTKLKEQIEAEKKKRAQLIDQMRRLRSKLNYKQEEQIAISKLSSINTVPKNLGRLKRMKSSIEFKISTQASTLAAERELIKELNKINKELEEAQSVYRFKRKAELVTKDIDEIGKALESYKNQVLEVDKKLDELYAQLRGSGGAWRRLEGGARPKRPQKREEPFEVSLEDIATIRKKEE